MDLHILLGQVMLGLVLFRLIWGLIGSSTARFAGFVRGPARDPRLSARREARGLRPQSARRAERPRLAAAARHVQIGLGLFATDEDGLYRGRCRTWSASNRRGPSPSGTRRLLVILRSSALHVAAILYYLVVRRDNLVAPMVTGRRAAPGGGERDGRGAGLAFPARRRRSRRGSLG